MSVRRALLPALTSLLLLLTGCGAGQSTADPPLPPPTSSATSQAPKPETPEHFIRRWAAEDIRMQRRGHTATFREMSQGCGGCAKVADLVERIFARGGYIHTQGWRVVKVVHLPSGLFNLRVYSGATVYSESSAGPVHHLPAGPALFQLSLNRKRTPWNVGSFIQVAL